METAHEYTAKLEISGITGDYFYIYKTGVNGPVGVVVKQANDLGYGYTCCDKKLLPVPFSLKWIEAVRRLTPQYFM